MSQNERDEPCVCHSLERRKSDSAGQAATPGRKLDTLPWPAESSSAAWIADQGVPSVVIMPTPALKLKAHPTHVTPCLRRWFSQLV